MISCKTSTAATIGLGMLSQRPRRRQRHDQGRPDRLRRPGQRRGREHLRGGGHHLQHQAPRHGRRVRGPPQELPREPAEQRACKDKFDVSDDRCFVGFDAYQKVIDCCDLVMLATPPGFRPQHIEATIKAGKHLFTEKPVAVDGTGIRKVLAADEEAKKKGLSVVAGTQRRHQAGYIESMKRIHDGAIGDLVTARVYWNQGDIWAHKRQPGWSDTEYQIRNWYHFLWLCGDHIVEQHVHNLDVACWALGAHPVKAVGMGGRQVITEPERGQSYDHFAVDYEFPNGVHVLSMCRQIAGCANNVSETIVGTKGQWHSDGYRFTGATARAASASTRGQPLRPGAHRPAREHRLAQAGQRAEAGGREHADGHHGPDVGLHRQGSHLGAGARTPSSTPSPRTSTWGPMEEPPVPRPGVTELI